MKSEFNKCSFEFEYLLVSYNQPNKKEHNENFKKIYEVIKNHEINDFLIEFSYINSLTINYSTINYNIFIESYIRNPHDDDVFESLLIIKDSITDDIEFVETNTLNNNLYTLNLMLNGRK